MLFVLGVMSTRLSTQRYEAWRSLIYACPPEGVDEEACAEEGEGEADEKGVGQALYRVRVCVCDERVMIEEGGVCRRCIRRWKGADRQTHPYTPHTRVSKNRDTHLSVYTWMSSRTCAHGREAEV